MTSETTEMITIPRVEFDAMQTELERLRAIFHLLDEPVPTLADLRPWRVVR